MNNGNQSLSLGLCKMKACYSALMKLPRLNCSHTNCNDNHIYWSKNCSWIIRILYFSKMVIYRIFYQKYLSLRIITKQKKNIKQGKLNESGLHLNNNTANRTLTNIPCKNSLVCPSVLIITSALLLSISIMSKNCHPSNTDVLILILDFVEILSITLQTFKEF